MRGLNSFINEVMRNPYLCDDTAVNEFLTQSNNSAWSKYKKVGVARLHALRSKRSFSSCATLSAFFFAVPEHQGGGDAHR